MHCVTLTFLTAASLFAQPWPRPKLVPVVSGLAFPVDIQNARDGTGRLFLVEQEGRIRILQDGALLADPFLDIRARVRAGGERGLLGLAFPPDFAAKRYFYVNYTEGRGAPDLRSVIARFRVLADDPNRADPNSEERVLVLNQPFDNHNGGQLAFGPRDGQLYAGFGDGGSGGDPQGNGQNISQLLGKMLRLDVEGQPFPQPEIWALGLRNPWRFAFDRETGDLWIGDVGQNRLEEIDYQPADAGPGRNYGWNVMEASQCYQPGCRTDGLVLPVFEYGRTLGISVTGGYVYRGSAYPERRGVYFLADYGTGRFWGVRRQGDGWANQELMRLDGTNVATFGEDENGELYFATHEAADGKLYRIADRTPEARSEFVLDPATGQPGVAPGREVYIYGWGIALEPQNTQVLFDGIAAEVVVVENQNGRELVVVRAPADLAGRETARMVLVSGGEPSAAVEVKIVPQPPE
jgi:glucose/arabinose dehydrogenase